MAARKILITGATGKQGTAAIKALLANPPPYDYHILALTRKSTSKAAKSLTANAKITVIEGDLNDCDSIFTKAGGVGSIWGVFCVTIVSMKKDGEKLEMKQGMDLVDAAIAHAVKHFVFTSVDRGGPDQSEVDATDVPHFVSKYNVEKHLKSKVRNRYDIYHLATGCIYGQSDSRLPGQSLRLDVGELGRQALTVCGHSGHWHLCSQSICILRHG